MRIVECITFATLANEGDNATSYPESLVCACIVRTVTKSASTAKKADGITVACPSCGYRPAMLLRDLDRAATSTAIVEVSRRGMAATSHGAALW